jgi:hypothetical protein
VDDADKQPAVPVTRVSDGAIARVRGAKDRWTAIHAAIQLAREIPPGERRTWLQDGRFRHPDPLVAQMFTLELEELMYREDPFALLEWEMANNSRSAPKHLQRLAKEDAEALLARGQGSTNPEQGRSMIFAALKELVNTEPDRVLKLAVDFPPPPDTDDLPMDMVRLLAKAGEADSSKLLDLAETKGDRWRSVLRASAARAMISKDFAAGLKWLAAEPDAGVLYAGAFNANGATMDEMRGNARKLAEHLALLPDDFAGMVNGVTLGGNWPDLYNVGGGEELWLEADLGRLGIGSREQVQLRAKLVEMLSGRDVSAAMKYLADPALFSAKQRMEALRQMRYDQQLRGKEMPAEMAAALSTDEVKAVAEMDAKHQAQRAAAPKGPLSISEQFARAMNDPDSDALHLPTHNWGPESRDQALAYVRAASSEKVAEMAERLTRTGGNLGSISGEIFRLALVNNTATAKQREHLIETSIHWGGDDPVRAAAWAETLPAGTERLRSIQNIAAQWSRQDPAGSEAWIATLKDKAEADAAREAVRIFEAKAKTRWEE